MYVYMLKKNHIFSYSCDKLTQEQVLKIYFLHFIIITYSIERERGKSDT